MEGKDGVTIGSLHKAPNVDLQGAVGHGVLVQFREITSGLATCSQEVLEVPFLF